MNAESFRDREITIFRSLPNSLGRNWVRAAVITALAAIPSACGSATSLDDEDSKGGYDDVLGSDSGATGDSEPSGPKVICKTDYECRDFKDVNPDKVLQCKDAKCVGNFCDFSGNIKDGSSCDAKNPCTSDDSCTQGICLGSLKQCEDDKDPCTKDFCDEETGKCNESQPVGAPCDDGDDCTVNDACNNIGVCLGEVDLCNDDNPCTTDYCDQNAGVCQHEKVEDGKVCNEDNQCTGKGVCKDGQCSSGVSKDCDDANECTKDSCDKNKGCLNEPIIGQSCDDKNACTLGDQCDDSGDCKKHQAEKDCDDGIQCTLDSCDPENGECTHINDATIPCNDGDQCTNNDVCKGGQCKGKISALHTYLSPSVDPAVFDFDSSNPCYYLDVDPSTSKCAVFVNVGAFCKEITCLDLGEGPVNGTADGTCKDFRSPEGQPVTAQSLKECQVGCFINN